MSNMGLVELLDSLSVEYYKGTRIVSIGEVCKETAEILMIVKDKHKTAPEAVAAIEAVIQSLKDNPLNQNTND